MGARDVDPAPGMPFAFDQYVTRLDLIIRNFMPSVYAQHGLPAVTLAIYLLTYIILVIYLLTHSRFDFVGA